MLGSCVHPTSSSASVLLWEVSLHNGFGAGRNATSLTLCSSPIREKVRSSPVESWPMGGGESANAQGGAPGRVRTRLCDGRSC